MYYLPVYYFIMLCAEIYELLLQNNYTSTSIYNIMYISYFVNQNVHIDLNVNKSMSLERDVMYTLCINNNLLICICVHVLLCLCVYVYVLCHATFVFQGLHVVLFINKVMCPIYIYVITFSTALKHGEK